MSRRLDLPIALLVWLAGFACVRWTGSWTPLAAGAVVAAARLVVGEEATRRLLSPRPWALAVGAAAAVAMAAATYVAYRAVAAVPGVAAGTADLYRVLNAEGYRRGALAALVLLVATSEEIVWRGRLLARWDAAAGPRLDASRLGLVVGAAAAYAAAHATSGAPLLVAVAFLCGVAWALLRVATRSLWPSIVCHAGWDAAVLLLWPLA